MTAFTVRLSDIARRISEGDDGRKIDTSTLRVMCATGVLKNHALKDGNSWRIPLDIANDLVANWKPYTRWEPSQKTAATQG